VVQSQVVRSNEELMFAYQQHGDLAAFAELVARHERPLWNYLRRFVRDPEAAEDLLQETFLRVVKGAAGFRASAKFSTWLYTIGRNLCTDYARGMVHRRALSLDHESDTRDSDPGPTSRVAQIEGGARSGEAQMIDRELAMQIERAIDALPEVQREVFLMREVMSLSFAEIAVAVGVPEPTVKSRMRYALEHLRAELAAYARPQTAERQEGEC
jgi:RNA polymerase sigma-70 factor, ECF subfamily